MIYIHGHGPFIKTLNINEFSFVFSMQTSQFLPRKLMITFFSEQAQMPDPKTYKQHFENKHPKNDMPDDLKSI